MWCSERLWRNKRLTLNNRKIEKISRRRWCLWSSTNWSLQSLRLRMFWLSGPRSSYPALGPWSPAPSPHKSFNKRNHLLVKVQSLWSCAHCFQWFTGYLNHTDLLMSQVHVFKETTPLLNVHLSFFVDFILCMFKVRTKKIRLICWMCTKLQINTEWHCSGVFIVDFDHSSISV